jgi:uncharacterized protein YjbI with pentapeptide repeats
MAEEERRKVDLDAPLSADTIYRLINGSIQSGKSLWLQRANLSEANLWSDNLWGDNLWGANLGGARYNADTTWPECFDPEAAGAVLYRAVLYP